MRHQNEPFFLSSIMKNYPPQRRAQLSAAAPTKSRYDFEWPTLLLMVICMATLPTLTIYSVQLPLWVTMPILTIILTLHSSLQHEVLHGHPFKNALINEALIFVPVGLFIPYRRFRDTHLQHHFDPKLTDPYDDPESNYLDPKVWAKLGVFLQTLFRFNNTLAGRMTVGPAIGLWAFYRTDWRHLAKGERSVILAYFLHAAGMGPLFWWLTNVSTMPIWAYFCCAYSGLSLLKVRTFLEHRAHEKVLARTVIIEDRGFFALLFLNNNFHLVHHTHPKLAWYKLPAHYDQRKEVFLDRNQSYSYPSYIAIFRKYFFRTKDPVPHPIWPFPKRD